MPAARPGRAPRRLALAASLVAVAGAAVPTAAQAATQYPVKLDGIGVSTQLGGGGSFGLYTFAVQKATDGAQPTAWVSPFTRATNDKVTLFGHCVELDQGAGQTTRTSARATISRSTTAPRTPSRPATTTCGSRSSSGC